MTTVTTATYDSCDRIRLASTSTMT